MWWIRSYKKFCIFFFSHETHTKRGNNALLRKKDIKIGWQIIVTGCVKTDWFGSEAWLLSCPECSVGDFTGSGSIIHRDLKYAETQGYTYVPYAPIELRLFQIAAIKTFFDVWPFTHKMLGYLLNSPLSKIVDDTYNFEVSWYFSVTTAPKYLHLVFLQSKQYERSYYKTTNITLTYRQFY